MRRGTWFRPWWYALGWVLAFCALVALAFLRIQFVTQILNIIGLLLVFVGIPAYFVCLGLWLAGVGAKPVSDEPASSEPVE